MTDKPIAEKRIEFDEALAEFENGRPIPQPLPANSDGEISGHPTDHSRKAVDKILRGIVKAAIELAIIRHDLRTEDGYFLNQPEQMAGIVNDVFNAMHGIDTCAEEPVAEVVAFRRMAAGNAPIDREAVFAAADVRFRQLSEECLADDTSSQDFYRNGYAQGVKDSQEGQNKKIAPRELAKEYPDLLYLFGEEYFQNLRKRLCSLADTIARPDALDEFCPKCKALPGKPCREEYGTPRDSTTHPSRQRKANGRKRRP